jgi:alpha-L-fucosidase 2
MIKQLIILGAAGVLASCAIADPVAILPPPAEQNLVLEAPITIWADAIPLGNGLTGGLLWGEDNLLRLSLDRGDLWDERPIAGKDWWKRDTWAKGPKGSWEQYSNCPHPSKLPGGRIEITLAPGQKVRQFELDLATAEGIARLTQGEVRAFFSATAPVAMLRISGPHPEKVMVLSSVEISRKARGGAGGPDSQSVGRLGYPEAKSGSEGNASWYVQDCLEGSRYCVCTETRRAGEETLMAIAITSTLDAADPLALARQRCADALNQGYAALQKPHQAWWREFWGKSSVSIPEAKLQRHYQFVRYLYGAGSRLGHPPMPLQGVWTADNGSLPPWKGDYHNDLNTQTTYIAYQAAGNFDEGNAWLDYLWRLRPTWQAFAKDFYETDGLATPGVMSLAGQPLGGWGAYALSPTMTAWNAHLFYLHWLYTNDDAFLRDRAYPWCRDAALCMKGLLKPNKDGILVLPRSSSPEIHNNFYGLQPNTNYDLACLKMLFVSLTEMATVLGKTDEAKLWRELDQQLGDHHAGPDGELWLDAKSPLRESHRHQSNIIAFHPFNLITIDGTDTDRQRIAASMPWWSQLGKPGGKLGTGGWVGFSFPWVACACARTGDAEGALQHLQIFENSYTTRNGFNENGPGQYVFTLEANFLVMQAINEMLLQSWSPTPGIPDTGIIRLFPAMPWAWHDASFTDLRAEGGHQVSARRENNATTWFSITAGKDGIIRLRDNFGGREPKWSRGRVRKVGSNFEIELKKGKSIEATLEKPAAIPTAPASFIPMTVDYRKELSLPALSDHRPATASSNHSAPYTADKAFDGNPDTRWATQEMDKGWIAVDLGAEQLVGSVMLMELAFISCQEFSIDCLVGGKWTEVGRGTTINGIKKISFPPVAASQVRVNIRKTKGDRPTLGEVRVLAPEAK